MPAWFGELGSVDGSGVELGTETMLFPSPAAMVASVVSGEVGGWCGFSAASVSTSDTERMSSAFRCWGQ